jgi:glycosyltransferase involved in cell wall biosynthesis
MIRHSLSFKRYTSVRTMITIITATYNRADMVQVTINSILNQTYKNWELIIVDDGSDDHTEKLLRKYLTDPRISYLKKENTGQPDSLNVGAQYAKGDFITFLDSDDEAYPHWLETVSGMIDENTGIACAGAVRKLLNGKIIKEGPKETMIFGKKVKLKFTSGSLFIKRSIFIEAGGYDAEMRSNIQTDLGYRLLACLRNTRYHIVSIDEHLVQLNMHDKERIRTNWAKVEQGGLQLINKHYDIINQSHPQEIANMYMVVAFANYKLKNRRKSVYFSLKAIKKSPFQWKNYLKCIKYSIL